MAGQQSQEAWQATAQISRDALSKSIPRQWLLQESELPDRRHVKSVADFADICGRLSDLEVQMTRQNVDGLLQRYRTGQWTVEAVVTAFLKRATIGHQLLNFATEFLAESALGAARKLDEHFQKTGNLIGPLHGIPISVKEHIAIGGLICNASFVSKISNVAAEDALIVKLLKRAGSVIHVRTNQPQSIMHLDCDNNITGMTSNPIHPLLSPGGSSGGEGAALGFRCSVLGVGTDIGGSVRAPASFCNVYGFKPTALRNPLLGLVGTMGGQESIRGCVGPLGQSLEDLVTFQKAIIDQEPWETETVLVPLPWKNVSLSRHNLTVGILYDDGVVRPHPPVLRALVQAEQKLKSAGIRTVKWEPYKHSEAWDLVYQLYFADGGERVRAALSASGEPTLPLTEYILGGSQRTPLTISENWNLNAQRELYRREYHARMKEAGVDVILCPGYTGVGVTQGQAQYWNYTAVWNILDQPAVTFPSDVSADKAVDVVDSSYSPRSPVDRREYQAYDADLFDGIPVSLQLIGKHHQDELLLDAARLVEGAIRRRELSADAKL